MRYTARMSLRAQGDAKGVGPDQLRLLAKIARMYHERGVRQPQIAADLGISQSRVSRMLRLASDLGIVRTTVMMPEGVHTDLEDAVEAKYGLRECVIVEVDGGSEDVIPALGAVAAGYVSTTLMMGDDIVGISSWSATLLATVEAMRPHNGAPTSIITQLVGGVGDPQVQVTANRLLDRLATTTGARPIFLPTPGLVRDAAVREALLQDPAIAGVLDAWDRLTIALVGIGSVQPSPLLQRSGNAVDQDQQDELRRLGAVGDVCFRFFDQEGKLVDSPFNDRVVGITPEQLKRVPRRIGVAGGSNKLAAIRAALTGGWINIVITDMETAQGLLGRDG
jgi:DNA-binding transcriptional regulator LsrR (DeoR family)